MSKKPSTPAPWFRESVQRERALWLADDDVGAAREHARRESDREYLKESLKLARRYFDGFEAQDGYSLREITQLSGARLKKLRKYAAQVRQEQAGDHVEKLARDKAQRKVLATYTGQSHLKGRKRFIVHTPHPATTKVKIVKRKGRKQPAVEVQEKVRGGTLADRFFHIGDYRKKPAVTFKQIEQTVKKMLKDMPDGYYVMVTSNHGHIGAPIPRNMILRELSQSYFAYDVLRKYEKRDGNVGRKDDRGLAETVTGFKLVSFTEEGADREYRTRRTRRQALRDARQAERAKKQRRIRKRLRR